MGFENPESAASYEVDKEQSKEIWKPWMIEAYGKAQEVFEENSIDPNDFKGTLEYAGEDIDGDIERINDLKDQFEDDDAKKVADILEAIIIDKSETILGSDMSIIKTSDFDDIENKADVIAQLDVDKHLSLAVDVTFGGGAVEKKLSQIREEIDADKLRDIKYFETDIGSLGAKKRQKLEQVPRVVIGVETSTVSDLSAAWVRGDDEYIGESETQYALLEEMRMQLSTFTAYAEQGGHEEVAHKYKEALESLEKILETKEVPQSDSAWQEDRVLRGIKRNLNNMFSSLEDEAA